jgi:hypothetical protein
MRKKLIFVALVVAATHTQGQTNVSKYEDEVRKRSAIWNTAFAQRDIPALTGLFSETLRWRLPLVNLRIAQNVFSYSTLCSKGDQMLPGTMSQLKLK